MVFANPFLTSTFLASRVARRFFTLFLLCSVVPMGMLAIFSYLHVSNQLVAQGHQQLVSECRSLGMATVEYLQYLESDLKIAQDSLEAAQPGDLTLDLGDLPDGFDSRFSGLLLVSGIGGGELLQLGRPQPLPSLDKQQTEHLQEGKTLVLFQPASPETSAVLIVRMLKDKESLLVGTAVGSSLWESLTTDWDHFAADEKGRKLFSSLGKTMPELELARNQSRNRVSGAFEWRKDGKSHSAAYREFFLEPSFGVRFTVVSSRSDAEILEPLTAFGRRFLLVGILTTLVVVLVSINQIKMSLAPIQLLHAGTQRLAENDFGTRVDVRSGDEFEELADSFNSMSEKLQHRTVELERASNAKMEFLANMSHELRTPMTAILGFADICVDSETTESERKRCLGIVRENSEHLLTVINDILDVSRIEAGGLTMEATRFDTEGLVTNVVGLLKSTLQNKKITLQTEIDGEVPKSLVTDSVRLQQILLNLLGNAIKFTNRGHVRLVVRPHKQEGAKDLLAFDVYDTGVGIAPNKIDSIFDAFVQADSSTTRVYGGTGLGLPISRSLAELLGGSLECRSELGVGSVFTLLIDPGPLVEQQPALEPSEDLVDAPLVKDEEQATALSGCVLVADDVAINRRLAGIILRRAGMDVEFAENGLEAVEMANRAVSSGNEYLVILMDMQMPVMSGYEATTTLRSSGYSGPIVAFTSHSMAEERDRCAAVGCDDFVGKPIDKQALLALIESLVQQHAVDHA